MTLICEECGKIYHIDPEKLRSKLKGDVAKTKCHVFKHVNESKCISIYYGYNGLTFGYSQHDFVSSEWMNAERATEEEFEAAKAKFIQLMNEPHD